MYSENFYINHKFAMRTKWFVDNNKKSFLFFLSAVTKSNESNFIASPKVFSWSENSGLSQLIFLFLVVWDAVCYVDHINQIINNSLISLIFWTIFFGYLVFCRVFRKIGSFLLSIYTWVQAPSSGISAFKKLEFLHLTLPKCSYLNAENPVLKIHTHE